MLAQGTIFKGLEKGIWLESQLNFLTLLAQAVEPSLFNMSDLEKFLSILVGISVLMSTVSGAFMFIIGLKVKAALAENQIAFDKMMRTELEKYLTQRAHDTYVSGHSDETERIRRDHQVLHEGVAGRLGELGAFKHATENLTARHVLEIFNLQRDTKEMEALLTKTCDTVLKNASKLEVVEERLKEIKEEWLKDLNDRNRDK